MRYSAAGMAALTAAGWTPSRRFDPSRWIAVLTAEGYVASPAAVDLLASLGGLVVHMPADPPRNPYPHDLVFDPVYAGTGERDRTEEWEAALGVRLFPVAHVTQAWPVWVAPSGAAYYGLEFGLYSLGGSFAEALDRLLAADVGEVAIAEPGAAADGGGVSRFPRFVAHSAPAAAELGRSAIKMSKILEQLDHPFWGTVQRRSGYDGWDLELTDSLPDGTDVKLRFYFDDPNDQTVQENFSLIRARWSELWPRIVDRIAKMKTDYGYGNPTYDPASDWFTISVPENRIGDGAEWSVMLQATEAGWLIDFKGWNDFGGQGVF